LELREAYETLWRRKRGGNTTKSLLGRAESLRSPESLKRSPHDDVPLSRNGEKLFFCGEFSWVFCPAVFGARKATTGKDLYLLK